MMKGPTNIDPIEATTRAFDIGGMMLMILRKIPVGADVVPTTTT